MELTVKLKENGQITAKLTDIGAEFPLVIHHKEGLTIALDHKEMLTLANVLISFVGIENIPVREI